MNHAHQLCEEGTAICLNGVTVTYQDVLALWQVNLDVSLGQYVGIAGPNGSGKTTLLKTILGLIKPQEGQVSIYGLPIDHDNKEILKKIAYVPQAHQIDPFFPATVEDVVLMGRQGLKRLGQRIDKKDMELVEKELKTIGLWKERNRPIGHLSGGQQQKTLIARALVREPEILLLDEPTSNLDFKITKEIMDIINYLHETRELTILAVHHNLKLMRADVERMIILDKAIVYDGSPNNPEVDEIIQKTFFS
ncbi:MAG: metal ABC transporter ATP-binding protein [Promethearchaeota archaeon]